uniref:Uncharacterized protein n=1 Tax=Arundo donax TaxID=35708 RepID=A0A0A9B0S8_ARUDO
MEAFLLEELRLHRSDVTVTRYLKEAFLIKFKLIISRTAMRRTGAAD